MLAASPHAFLRCSRRFERPPLLPSEHILELHHPTIGKQQSGVVTRNERAARDLLMAVPHEEVEKSGPYVIAAGHSDGDCPFGSVRRGGAKVRVSVQSRLWQARAAAPPPPAQRW